MRAEHPASRLRHRLKLQQPVRTQDTMGGFSTVWQDIVELWGEVTFASGKAVFDAERAELRQRHVVAIRAREGIRMDMRLLYDEREFFIRAINPENGRERGMMELVVEERVET